MRVKGPDMVKFLGWKHIEGRGWIADMISDDPGIDIPAIKCGASLSIDGHNYIVTRVECSYGLTYLPRFGVVVRGTPESVVE